MKNTIYVEGIKRYLMSESGVGVSSFYTIFDNLGLKLTQVSDELYNITRK